MASPTVPAATHECRECCSFCDRLVHPAGCIARNCPSLYAYDDEQTGRRYMGCVHKVFGVEIDVEVFKEQERTRHGFGGVRMTGAPMPQCRLSVERAYDGTGQAFECVNPGFFDSPPLRESAFDLRDRL